MELTPQSHAIDLSAGGILARAEQTVATAGERLLLERLHRTLDEGGSTALTSFTETLLPHLHMLIALLPRLLQEEMEPATLEVVQTLGALLQERGISLNDVVNEGVYLHDRLLGEVALHLRENDRALVMAISQLSRVLLKVGQGTLLSYYESATAALAQLAHSDALTGLSNRRYFETRFGEEILRAQRMTRPLAVALLDVDDLKTVNDTFGHVAGDDLLRLVAIPMREQTRGIDVAARIGGDEFALLLPETDRAGAEALLDRIMQGVADQRIHDQLPRLSAGVAVYPADGTSSRELLEHADGVLYQAKRATRGREP